ncbi:hypothetical protein BHM03_00061999 [Ensete ventricosum]|nr:hypothetical protein BHM03_00061999 [Ensete ventricosum]
MPSPSPPPSKMLLRSIMVGPKMGPAVAADHRSGSNGVGGVSVLVRGVTKRWRLVTVYVREEARKASPQAFFHASRAGREAVCCLRLQAGFLIRKRTRVLRLLHPGNSN